MRGWVAGRRRGVAVCECGGVRIGAFMCCDEGCGGGDGGGGGGVPVCVCVS